MTADPDGPLHRPVSVAHLPEGGLDVTMEASAEERAALAAEFGLPAIRSLTGRFHLAGTPRHVEVTGRVAAEITQVCVVTLDEFDSGIEEEVAVEFAPLSDEARARREAQDPADDGPDDLVNGQIDLGALAAEFLALGLDPYPRKPGAVFAQGEAAEVSGSPFAALKRLTSQE